MLPEEKELLKIGAEAALKPLVNFAERLFGGAVDQIGGGWQDRLMVRRMIRRIQFFKEINDAIAEAGFDPLQIADAIGVPALEAASLQDNETIRKKWAAMMANAADPRQINPVHQSFPLILRELGPREVQFLDALYVEMAAFGEENPHHMDNPEVDRVAGRRWEKGSLFSTYLSAGLGRREHLAPHPTEGDIERGGEDLEADMADFDVTLEVLASKNLVIEQVFTEPIDVTAITKVNKPAYAPRSVDVKTRRTYNFTRFGAMFVRACRYPQNDAPEKS